MRENPYRAYFEQAADVLFVLEPDDGSSSGEPDESGGFHYVEVNDALLQATGLSREGIVGKSPEDLLPADQTERVKAEYRRCLLGGEPVQFEQILNVPTGSRSWQVRLSPLRDGTGGVVQLLGAARDITWSRDFAQQLETVAAELPGFVYQLRLSAENEWDFTFVGERVEDICGVKADAVLADAGALMHRIHPDDYQRVIEESLASARSLIPGRSDFRICHRDGRIVWVEAHDLPQPLGDGSILLTGYINEISVQKALEAALISSETRYRQLVENANDIIYSLTAGGVFTYVSPNWTAQLGHPVESVIGTSISDHLHPDDLPRAMGVLQTIDETGRPQSGIEYRVRHRDGEWRWHTSNVSPFPSLEGGVDAYMGIARDITDQREMVERIRHLAEHDMLTDLPNRGLFFSHLEQAIRLARRRGERLALLFIDLDKFKPVNDHLGHAVGDQLLVDVARRMQSILRESDLVGRIGGDEFIVMLNDLKSPEEVLTVANSLLEGLREPFVLGEHRAEISASIGGALFPDHGDDGEALSRAADEAMYRAKEAGRDGVVLAD